MFLEEKYILEYIQTTLMEMRLGKISIKDRYHHNTSFSNASSLIKYGILTINDLNKMGITKYTKKQLQIMADTDSHINGIDAVSLSVVGLNDIYKGEEEYNPLKNNQVDFLISSDLNASRNSLHYGNEFLNYQSISNTLFRSIDIRLLGLIKKISESYTSDAVLKLIEYFNHLPSIAMALKEESLEIPLREMSSCDNIYLDIDKMVNIPKLVLKR